MVIKSLCENASDVPPRIDTFAPYHARPLGKAKRRSLDSFFEPVEYDGEVVHSYLRKIAEKYIWL